MTCNPFDKYSWELPLVDPTPVRRDDVIDGSKGHCQGGNEGATAGEIEDTDGTTSSVHGG